MTAEEAASYINNGDVVGFGGFTPAVQKRCTQKERNLK